MRQIRILSTGLVMLAIVGGSVFAERKKIDFSKAAVVMPFESSLKEVSSLFPETTRETIIAYLKEAALFSAVLTPEEAKDRDKANLIEITGKLEDFASGSQPGKIRGSGWKPAHAEFEIALKDLATDGVLWNHRIKADAFYLFPKASSTSQRSGLPDNSAKEFVKQLSAEKRPKEYPFFHLYGYSGSISSPSKLTGPHFGGGGEVRIGKRFSLSGEVGTFLDENGELYNLKGRDWGVRFSIGPSYHFARRFDQKFDPFLAGGISARAYYGDTGMNWSHRTDRLFYFGGGINYWFSPRYGVKLEFLDHAWPTKGTSLHYMDMRMGICFGFL